METPSEFAKHADLAFASYSNLRRGTPELRALIDEGRGLSSSQAQRFAETYAVVDFYNSPESGLQAAVFSDASGKKYLAIRGTESPADFLTDAIDIALLGSTNLQTQYRNLKAKVVAWIADGTLSPSFTVTGHSLGGFLAGSLTVDFPNNVSHAYLYNAPGVGGLGATLTYGLKSLLGLASQPTLDLSRISNIRSDAGISPIAGLGVAWGHPIAIGIENQLDPALFPNVPAALNHSMQPLTDSTSIYATLFRLAPAATIEQIGSVIKAASPINSKTLESTLDSLRRLIVGTDIVATPDGDRDAFHSNRQALDVAVTDGGTQGAFELRLIPSVAGMVQNAMQDDPEGLSYRYALRELNPYILVGGATAYSMHNIAGSLDLYDEDSHGGKLTEAWMRDRADFLAWKLQKNTIDSGDDVAILRQDFGAQSYLYTDLTLKNGSGQDYTLRVQGGNPLQQIDPIRITFGGDQSDVINGSTYDDSLYGGAGGDSLAGGSGNDRLEGGPGSDIYVYSSANAQGGFDTILDSDGQGSILFDNQALTGGHRANGNRFVSADGVFTYSVVGDLVSGGTLVINDVLEVRDFRNGDLGITLDVDVEPGGSDAYAYHYFGSDYPYAELGAGYPGNGYPNQALFLGSDFNDEYRAASAVAGEPQVEGASPGYFFGKGGDDTFLGSIPIGGDRASGGPGDDALFGEALGASLPPDTGSPPSGDFLYGGAGQDVIVGSRFDDQLFGDFESIYAFDFDNVLSPAFHGSVDLSFLLDPNSYDIRANWGPDSRHFSTPGQLLDYALGLTSNSDVETHYDDAIEGGAGNDLIVGGNGSDVLAGGAGDDTLVGDYEMNMYRAPEPLNPTGQSAFGEYAYLLGRPGDDHIDGGEGNDTISDVFGGNDYIVGGPGDDTIEQRDLPPLDAFFRDGHAPELAFSVNLVDGGSGDDTITSISHGSTGSVEIIGGEGNDAILAQAFAVSVSGGIGNDRIEVFDSDTVDIDAGSGDDTINASAAHLSIAPGNGNDLIVAEGFYDLRIDQPGSAAGDSDTLRLPLWNAHDVALERTGDDLFLTDNALGASASIGEWFSGPQYDLESIEFENAVVWTSANISSLFEATPGAPASTDGDDFLFATQWVPVVTGGEGNDQLTGWHSNVLMDGGEGSDILTLRSSAGGFLVGGKGDDQLSAAQPSTVVAFNRGDGVDSLVLWSGTISLGAGIRPDDIRFSLSATGIALGLGETDQLTLVFSPGEAPPVTPPDVHLQFVSPDGIALYDLMTPLSLFFAQAMENPDAGEWAPEAGWDGFLISSGTESAIGGAIAHAYATQGSLADVSAQKVAETLESAAFGISPQPFVTVPAANEDGGAVDASEPQGGSMPTGQGAGESTTDELPTDAVAESDDPAPDVDVLPPEAASEPDDGQSSADEGSSDEIGDAAEYVADQGSPTVADGANGSVETDAAADTPILVPVIESNDQELIAVNDPEDPVSVNTGQESVTSVIAHGPDESIAEASPDAAPGMPEENASDGGTQQIVIELPPVEISDASGSSDAQGELPIPGQGSETSTPSDSPMETMEPVDPADAAEASPPAVESLSDDIVQSIADENPSDATNTACGSNADQDGSIAIDGIEVPFEAAPEADNPVPLPDAATDDQVSTSDNGEAHQAQENASPGSGTSVNLDAPPIDVAAVEADVTMPSFEVEVTPPLQTMPGPNSADTASIDAGGIVDGTGQLPGVQGEVSETSFELEVTRPPETMPEPNSAVTASIDTSGIVDGSGQLPGVLGETSETSFEMEVTPPLQTMPGPNSADTASIDAGGIVDGIGPLPDVQSEVSENSSPRAESTQSVESPDQSSDGLAAASLPLAVSGEPHAASTVESNEALLARSPAALDTTRLAEWYSGSPVSAGADEIVSLQAMLDAAQRFDPLANSGSSESTVPSGAGIETGSHDDSGSAPATMLDHWSYTNALINFHLSGAGLSELGSDISREYVHGSRGFGAELAVTSPALAGAVASELHSLYGQLRPFAGIQEGLATLG